jgi:hypothetical protein
MKKHRKGRFHRKLMMQKTKRKGNIPLHSLYDEQSPEVLEMISKK